MSIIQGKERNPLFLDAKGRDTEQVRVALVERIDRPGSLGVAMRGARFVIALPDGYDAATTVCYNQGYVIVAHPMLPPLQLDFSTGKYQIIDDAHVSMQNGKFKLN